MQAPRALIGNRLRTDGALANAREVPTHLTYWSKVSGQPLVSGRRAAYMEAAGRSCKATCPGRVLGERRGYPRSTSLGCRPPLSAKIAEPPFGAALSLEKFDPEAFSKPAGVELLRDNPLTGISDNIGKLEQARRRGVQPDDTIDAPKPPVVPPCALKLGCEARMIVVLVHVGDHIHIRDALPP